MKKLVCYLLLSMCAIAVHAQNTPNTITLFGYTLQCSNAQEIEISGRATGDMKINCFLPNPSSTISNLTVDIHLFGKENKPTIEFMESMINKLAGKNDERYTFSCPGTNNVIGGYRYPFDVLPTETITLDTPTFMARIHHYLSSQTPVFSSTKYLNQLCHWKPW